MDTSFVLNHLKSKGIPVISIFISGHKIIENKYMLQYFHGDDKNNINGIEVIQKALRPITSFCMKEHVGDNHFILHIWLKNG